MNKSHYIFDIETFRNFFCVTFLNVDDESELKTFIISWDLRIDEVNKLRSFLEERVSMLIGYNNLFFDAPILLYVLEYSGRNINEDIFEMVQSIISSERGEYYGHRREFPWPQMDLMKLMAFDKLGVSLKQCAINLKWKKIQDLPLPYDHLVTREDVETIIKYNINDVLISFELYKALQPQIELRRELSALYDVDLLSASDSKIANILLEKIYADETGIDVKQLKHQRTKREFLWLKDCISKKIKFKTRKLKDLKFEIGNTLVVSENTFAYKKELQFGNCTYVLGVGGLHSDDGPGRFNSDENFVIMDADVSSYYPFIILNDQIKPEHLGEDFLDILRKITEERIEAKKAGNKVKADGLKITINSIFGKMGSNTFWLEDSKAMLSVTVSGQLFLLMLIEALTLAGITVISANTDGIVSKIPRSLLDKYYEVCKWWEQETDFQLEFTEYQSYIRSDVNNYITKKPDGKTKEKGRYLKELDLKKGYHYPIVPKALYEYFVNGKPIDTTLKEAECVLDFCISQKAGKDFYFEFRKDDSTTRLQKTNRFYISKSGGNIVKVNSKSGTEIGLYVGKTSQILNDYDSSLPISNYDIDYDFYKEEAEKYITEIENASFPFELNMEEVSEDVDGDIDLDLDNLNTDKIKINPPKFRYSQASYVFDKRNNTIWRGIASIKFVTDKVAKELQKISSDYFPTFVDLLVSIEENCSINSRQMDTLIRLNFFEEFGYNGKLLKIYEEFYKGKNKYLKKLKGATKEKRKSALIDFEKSLPNTRINILQQIYYEEDLLNYIQSRYELDKKYVYVKKVIEFTNNEGQRYSPKVEIVCLANGKSQTVKVENRVFDNNPLNGGDIIFCSNFKQKNAVSKINDMWVEDENKPKVWWLIGYNVLTEREIARLV